MTDGPDSLRFSSSPEFDQSVEDLASNAILSVAHTRGAKGARLSSDHLNALMDGVTAADARAAEDAVTALLDTGVAPELILDGYIPEVSRRLGMAWKFDDIGFVQVTLALSRLLSAVHRLSDLLSYPGQGEQQSGVVLVVLSNNRHSLGSIVLATQLRRLGISVRILMECSSDDVLQELRNNCFDAVFVSAAGTDDIGTLRSLVRKIRRQSEHDTPVVIGGPLLGIGGNALAETGADFTTSDAHEAARLCRLKIFPAASHPRSESASATHRRSRPPRGSP